jgi:predicted transcriptional regulator
MTATGIDRARRFNGRLTMDETQSVQDGDERSNHGASPDEILRALADPERLAVAGALARRPQTVAELSAEVGLPVRRVRRHLNRLAGAGVARVDRDRRTYHLLPETLRDAAREVGPPREAGLALGAVFEEEESVLRHYFRGGRLREIPAKQSKRRIVLERLALEFEVGVRYREQEVNEILQRFHNDHAALRRHLVDEDLLSRGGGEYWRSGGPVEL